MYKRAWLALALLGALLLASCAEQTKLVDMSETSIGGYRAVVWEERTYMPFAVVSKNDRGEQIGYVNGDKDERISAYLGYSPQEWLVSWMPMDGGAMLLKEVSVTDIPDGLEQEYQ